MTFSKEYDLDLYSCWGHYLRLSTEEGGMVTGSQEYGIHNGSYEISAIPYSGYSFTQWSDGDTTAERTIILTENTTLSAQFEGSGETIGGVWYLTTSIPWGDTAYSWNNGPLPVNGTDTWGDGGAIASATLWKNRNSGWWQLDVYVNDAYDEGFYTGVISTSGFTEKSLEGTFVGYATIPFTLTWKES